MTTTEARSSVTYTLSSPKGFPVLFTLRSDDEGELMELMEDTEEYFVKHGYSPSNRSGGAKPFEESKPNTEEATEKQMALLKSKNLWKEGMSKSEATALIGSVLGK